MVIDALVTVKMVEDQARVRCGPPEVTSDFARRFVKYKRPRLAFITVDIDTCNEGQVSYGQSQSPLDIRGRGVKCMFQCCCLGAPRPLEPRLQ